MANKDFKVSYRASDDGFGSTTTKAGAQLRMLGREVQGLAGGELHHLQERLAGLFSVQFLEGKIEEAIRFADRIRSLSDMTQITVESLQELEFAAKQAGTPFEVVIAAIRNLERARISALGGNKPDLASFERLEVSLDNLKKLPGEQLFKQIAQAIREGNYSAQQLTDTLNVMGRSASQLFPLFNAGVDEMTEKARKAGVVMKEDLVNTLDELGDQMEELGSRFRLAFGLLGGYLAVVGNKLAETVALATNFITAFGAGWIRAKEQLDQLNSTRGWMAAKEAIPRAISESFHDAFESIGEDWDRLIGKISEPPKERGKINDQAEFNAERDQKAAELKLKNDERENELALKALPIEERKNRLIERRLELLREMSYAQNALEKETAREQLNKVTEELLTLQSALNSAQANPGSANGFGRNLDELTRAGFFTGGRPLELVDVARQQLTVLKEVARGVDTLPASLDARLG